MYLKSFYTLTLIFLFISSAGSMAQPSQGSYWFTAYAGLGFHNSDITGEEQNFVDQNEIYIYLDDSPTPSSINYFYLDYELGLNMEYQVNTDLSLGIKCKYNFVSQTMLTVDDPVYRESRMLLRYAQVGPVLTKWLNIHGLWFNLSGSAGIVWGNLNRVPVLANEIDNFNDWTPELAHFMSAYNDDLQCNGYGASLEFYYFNNSFEKLFFRIGFKIDYATLDTSDKVFVYINNSSVYNFQFVAGIGYIKPKKLSGK